MNIQALHDLKEMLCKELDEITRKGELTAGSLDTVDKLTHSLKSLETIIAMHEYGDDSGYYRESNRRSYARRDRMGRYSREEARADMVSDLREIMHSTTDERMKNKLSRFISEIENG